MAPFANLEVTELNVTDSYAGKLLDFLTVGFAHTSYLAISAFVELEFKHRIGIIAL